MIEYPFSLQAEHIADKFSSSLENGLSTDLAQAYLKKFGENQVPEHKPKKWTQILVDQMANPIIYILVAAGFLAFIFRDWLEGIAILVVILISVGIGFFLELRAIRSLEALRKMGQAMTMVIRSGEIIRVKAFKLVPGDLIILQSGDVISADARLVETDNLTIKEAALTGESAGVSKQTEPLPINTPLTHQNNMLFKGTMVVTGSAKAIITGTGKHTQLGHIQQMGIDAQKQTTPLERKLNQLGKRLIWLTLLLTILIVISGYLRGMDIIFMIETGVALAVAAIPEGLPIVATIALARGMLRLSKRQVIIKKLEAVETLGATDIICTDKTGTLTEDQMEVHTLVFEDSTVTSIMKQEANTIGDLRKKPSFEKLVLACILCNNVKSNPYLSTVDALEMALLNFAERMGYDVATVRKKYPEILELPFDSQRRLMATCHLIEEGYGVFVKGAFESVSPNCRSIFSNGKTKPFHSEKWKDQVNALAGQGLRTLAFAYKQCSKKPTSEMLLEDLTLVGLIGCIDPARDDIDETIEVYKKAGIKVVMVTGDHPATSRKIAEEIGLVSNDMPNDVVLVGSRLLHFDTHNTNTAKKLLNASILARVTPEQKLQLVRFYQSNDHVVGMIGDGINDVPALRNADIGIAMGIRGTGAAREAADVILKNDKFTAIEMAIHQGRVVFQNIRQFVVYLLSCNLAEILSVGIAALLGLPSPLLPLQILFLNLVTDTFPALALGLGKGPKNIMEQPPRNPKESIMTRKDWLTTALYGIAISFGVLGIVVYADLVLGLPSSNINNMAFYTLVLAQLLNVFNLPKHRESFFKNEVTRNAWVWAAILISLLITFGAYLATPIAKALGLLPITGEQLMLTVLFAFGSLLLAQLVKRLGRVF